MRRTNILSEEFIDFTPVDGGKASKEYAGGASWFKKGNDKQVVVTNKESFAPKILPEKVTKCSLISKGVIDGVCSSDKTIKAIGGILGEHIIETKYGIDSNTRKHVIDKAMHETKCTDEKCVLKSNLAKKAVGNDTALGEIQVNMKIDGPTDTSLLNNFNIDNTLSQWQNQYRDFFAYNFNMRDFEQKGDTLATINLAELYKKGYRTAACVINSDYYKGSGKHWMALFADMRNPGKFSVEFFNSSGNPPYAEFAAWLQKSKEQLNDVYSELGTSGDVEIILCCDLPHQKTKTECGLYSLYYIWARLSGVPASFFKKYIISDVLMIALRQHLFDGTANKSGVTGKGGKGPLGINSNDEFDIKKYEEKSKIPWENDVDRETIQKATGGTFAAKKAAIEGGWINSSEAAQSDHVEHSSRISYAELGCKINEPVESVTKKLVEAGLLNKMFIYGNLATEEEIKMKKATENDVFSLTINHGSEHQLPYRRRTKEPKLSLYSEHRKMLLGEIQAIIDCKEILSNGGVVIYANSDAHDARDSHDSCSHIPYLSKLFPWLKFIVYDSMNCKELQNDATHGNITVHREEFNEKTASLYSQNGQQSDATLFIANIKTNPNAMGNAAYERTVAEDMKNQLKMYKAGNFAAALFTFRLPYSETSTKTVTYLDGILYKGVFMPQTSAESRLLVKRSNGGKTRDYDVEIYEREMFYHNVIERIWRYFDHDVVGDGIDHCFDCRAEIEIIRNYLSTHSGQNGNSIVADREVSLMSRDITAALGSSLKIPPHGVCKNIKMEQKFGHLIAKYGDKIIKKRKQKKIDTM